MARCPRPSCNHNPSSLSANWMWLKKCNDCGEVFCHKCGKYGKYCPECGSQDVDQQHEKCYAD